MWVMSLNGARFKVVWAQEHLNTLKREIARYLEPNPYTLEPIQNDSGDWGAKGTITTQPPIHLSGIIGDCLNNARSALDYVMWELAGTYVGRKLIAPPDGNDRPYFPTFIDPNKFEKRGLESLAEYRIPDPVIREMRAVQPYNSGYQPLWCLNILVNVDKHRLLLLTRADFKEVSLSISRIAPSGNLPPEPEWVRLPEAEVKAEGSIFVAWQDISMPREPVERTLADIVELVADIVPRFDRFCL